MNFKTDTNITPIKPIPLNLAGSHMETGATVEINTNVRKKNKTYIIYTASTLTVLSSAYPQSPFTTLFCFHSLKCEKGVTV